MNKVIIKPTELVDVLQIISIAMQKELLNKEPDIDEIEKLNGLIFTLLKKTHNDNNICEIKLDNYHMNEIYAQLDIYRKFLLENNLVMVAEDFITLENKFNI